MGPLRTTRSALYGQGVSETAPGSAETSARAAARRMARERPTMREVAALAGVSLKTV